VSVTQTARPAAGTTGANGAEMLSTRRRGRVLRRFLCHRLAVASALLMIVVVLMTFPLASIVAPLNPNRIDFKNVASPPGKAHVMGTDLTGRDSWSRLVYGGRVSVSVGLVSVAIYVTIGTLIGAISGFYGGKIDAILMRFTDTVMAFPTLIILICIVAIVGPGLFNAMIAIGVIGWTGIARLVRGQILSLRETDFVTAARATGVPQRRIIWRHILPNVVAPITVAASFGVAGAILTEAGLSFLGLGVKPPRRAGVICSTRPSLSRSSRRWPGYGSRLA